MRRAFIVVPFVLLINAALPAFNSVAHGGPQAGALEPQASVGFKPLTEMTAETGTRARTAVCTAAAKTSHRPRI